MWSRTNVAIALGVAAVAIAASGCSPSFTDDNCQVDTDCFAGEACVDGRCELRGGADVERGDVGDADAARSDGTASDAAPASPAALAVTPSSASVGVGREVELTATVLDGSGEMLSDAEVSWTSSDGAVASVSVGGGGADQRDSSQRAVVEALAEGEATVTASIDDVSGTASLTVTPAQVESVRVSPDPAELRVGQERELTAQVLDGRGQSLPNRQIDWRVADSKTASVDGDGRVSAEAEGRTEVVAEVEGEEGSATVIVRKKSVDALQIEPSAPGQFPVGGDVQLRAVPHDTMGDPICTDETDQRNACGYAQKWASGTPSVATVDSSGNVAGKSPGSAQIFAFVSGSIASAEVTVTKKSEDIAPAADAGGDKSGQKVGEAVVLDGAGSSDPEGQALTFAWSYVSRPPASGATLTDSMQTTASFEPDEPGTYEIELTVTDPDNNADSDTVRVDVVDQPPSADAGSNQSGVELSETVNLDGSGSADPEGKALSYGWSFTDRPPNSSAKLADALKENPSFQPDEFGVYRVELTVTDPAGNADSDVVEIEVENQDPSVSFSVSGTDVTAGKYKVGSSISLDGTASSDPEGGSLTYQWSLGPKPGSATAKIQPSATENTSFTPDVEGTYGVTLTVTDPEGASASATSTVEAVDNLPPRADVAGNTSRTVSLMGGTVTVALDGTASTDHETAPGDLSFEWNKKSGPASVQFDDRLKAQTDATMTSTGTYELRLVATDEGGKTDSVVVTVEVQ